MTVRLWTAEDYTDEPQEEGVLVGSTPTLGPIPAMGSPRGFPLLGKKKKTLMIPLFYYSSLVFPTVNSTFVIMDTGLLIVLLAQVLCGKLFFADDLKIYCNIA